MNRDELMTALNRVMREVSGQGVIYSQAVAARLGVGGTELECLDCVVLRGGATAGDLARATGLTTGAITGVIDRLERAGYARREPDPADRRKVLVKATPAVATEIAPLYRPMAEASAAAMARYDDDALALLLDFLTTTYKAAVEATEALRAGAASNVAD
ncbi:MAG TPA: MarR family transcriptional regulator [Caulobacteraceae bacterium]|nr:MarR family transcriptional regulator [Caulobacteraceae bacterium]